MSNCPSDAEFAELKRCFADRTWRLNNLYWITDKRSNRVKFKLNTAQAKLAKDMHNRNVTLKCRQKGITTFWCIFALDCALFNSNFSAGIIAHNLDDAKEIFRTKVKFPYDNLPESIRLARPASQEQAGMLVFDNNSKISVSTSFRSGTLNLLHVSELGKIAAKYPDRAREIKSGALEAVPMDGIASYESTAEGACGYFYDVCKSAQDHEKGGHRLTPLDFKFHFFPWFIDDEYEMDPEGVVITAELEKYFTELEGTTGVALSPRKRAWYALKSKTLGDDMYREYPSCIAGDVQISTPNGLVPISDIEPDGHFVLAKYHKGTQEVFSVRTKLGYEIKSTKDHPYLQPGGIFVELSKLSIGDAVVLGRNEQWPKKNVTIKYDVMPFVKAAIEIDEDMALFLGIYMGDGSFHKGTLSIACDSQDDDVIAEVVRLLEKVSGGYPQIRLTGDKKGCSEVRISRNGFVRPFEELGIVRKNSSFNLKRNICVPWFIKMSPENVTKMFLRGLFEADGFVSREGNCIKLFSKYENFIRDVQLLLLQFGITSRLKAHNKKSGSGGLYTGWDLSLRTEESRVFVDKIGFLSKRKRERIVREVNAPHAVKRYKLDFLDTIESIECVGHDDVYDITTSTSMFSAGGVTVHNCPEEAFRSSIQGAYYAQQFSKVRSEKRICRVPVEDGIPVNTAWDLGMDDYTSIGFYQNIGREVRWIDYYENNGESLSHYVKVLADKGYLYGNNYFPHDVAVKELGTGKSRKEVLEGMGVRVTVAPNLAITDGIEAARKLLSICWFDETRCATLVSRLEAYRKAWNDKLGVFMEQAVHDEASHTADMFRYAAVTHQFDTPFGYEGAMGKKPVARVM